VDGFWTASVCIAISLRQDLDEAQATHKTLTFWLKPWADRADQVLLGGSRIIISPDLCASAVKMLEA